MKFKILPAQLHPVAIGAVEFLSQQWGLRKKTLKVEQGVTGIDDFCPVLQGLDGEGHLICVEVSERAYWPGLDPIVLSIKNSGLPLKLFVALAKDKSDSEFHEHSRRAKASGVGLLEIDLKDVIQSSISYPAVSQHLTGVRRIDRVPGLPRKYQVSL